LILAEEGSEGFSKKGTTLEGRVAQLLRLLGYNIQRNLILEGHEIDVCGEKDNRRIIVECKEYYEQLISRDLILIYATKVRDIQPDDAWFVTINDFEMSALELCKRYGIRAINGYYLEELEDKAITEKDRVELGAIPAEKKYLRRLHRRRTELSRENRRESEIRGVVDEINTLRKKSLVLPSFLFPTSERELEEQYVWLNEVEQMPKIIEGGEIGTTIVNLSGQPTVKGFRLSIVKIRKLTAYIIALIWVLMGIAFYGRETEFFDALWMGDVEMIYARVLTPVLYGVVALIFSIIPFILKDRLVIRSLKVTTMPSHNAVFVGRTLSFPTISEELPLNPLDVQSQQMYNRNVYLIDQQYLGLAKDYVVEKASWGIRAIRVDLDKRYSDETGEDTILVPTENASLVLDGGQIKITVNAIYILGDSFSQEKWFT
jgi:Holliday junction resolvase-like predicted endonuclease